MLPGDKCLLIIADPHNDFYVYLERTRELATALSRGNKSKKCIREERVGDDVLIAYDETSRVLAICSVKMVATVSA